MNVHYLRPKNKMSSNTMHFFILSRKHNLDMRCWPRYVSVLIISFAKKVAIDFCYFFSGIEDIALIEIMK